MHSLYSSSFPSVLLPYGNVHKEVHPYRLSQIYLRSVFTLGDSVNIVIKTEINSFIKPLLIDTLSFSKFGLKCHSYESTFKMSLKLHTVCNQLKLNFVYKNRVIQ